MPIKFDLEKLRKENNCYYYFETGLGDSENIKSYKVQSCLQAISSSFEKIFSIEIVKNLYDIGVKVYKKEIDKNRLTLIHDDSKNIEKYVNDEILNKKTIFFLDAHHVTSNSQCPIIDELNAINKLSFKEHVICIDDIRLLNAKRAWGLKVDARYNTHLEHIIDEIKKINNNYKIKYLNGIVDNDVLCAYI